MTPLRRTAAAGALGICLLLLAAGSAWGATTVGQLFTPIDGCASNSIYLQTGVAGGTGYTIPSDGVVTSWSYQLGNAAITGLRLEIADPGSAGSHTIVGQAAAGSQTPGAVNSYPARISVKAGDIVGIFFGGGGNCLLGTGMGGDAIDFHAGDLSPGASAMFTPLTGNRLPVEATVEGDADHDGFGDETQDQCPGALGPVNGCPSNAFSFGKVKKNKHKGTATIAVKVPGPGTLSSTGKKVKAQRPAREARASKEVTAAGTVRLLVKAKGKAKKKLNKTGKLKVKVKVTYTPTGGAANTQPKTLKLVKKH